MTALRIEREGPVLRVTLARPERRNAFDAALIAELTEAFSDVGDARAVVLAGDGPTFCAGADVDWQRSAIDLTYDENVEDAMRLYSMLEAIEACPAPVVARVQGHALGGGSGLVACVDIALAGEADDGLALEGMRLVWSAYFADPERAPPMPELRISSERSAEMVRSILADLPALEAGLPQIRVPVGFVHGSRSPMPVAASTDAAERIPGAWVELVEGAGHFVWVEAPGAVRAALRRLTAN